MNHFCLWSLTVNSGHPVKEYPIVMKEIIIKRVFFLNAIEIIVQLTKRGKKSALKEGVLSPFFLDISHLSLRNQGLVMSLRHEWKK